MVNLTKPYRYYLAFLLTLMFFDVHKYGSWMEGNATYWHPYAYIIIPIALLPVAYNFYNHTSGYIIDRIVIIVKGLFYGLTCAVVYNDLANLNYSDEYFLAGQYKGSTPLIIIFVVMSLNYILIMGVEKKP